MKKASRKPTDELRREYKRSDFGRLVRGKYARRIGVTTNVVVLEPEVAKAFPNDRKSATRSTPRRRARSAN